MLSEIKVSPPAALESASEEWITLVEFRLTYDGPLPCETKKGSIRAVKHTIREQFHPQLKDLCDRNPLFHRIGEAIQDAGKRVPGITHNERLIALSDRYRFNGTQFIPLIEGNLEMLCALDILFLRREKNLSLLTKPKDEYGGDLDNRLKVFLDALRVPRGLDELPKDLKPSEDPFYCLLEDDSLIYKLQVEADTLLGGGSEESKKNVRLIVRVTTKVSRVTFGNMGFAVSS